MREHRSPRGVVLVVVISGLVGLIGVSEFYDLGYTGAIEAAGGILFSGLLVLLYSRQTEIMDKQETLMQHQNRMMMEDHQPQLLFTVSAFDPSEDVVTFDVTNVGSGTAFDIGLELELDPREDGRENLVSYGRVVVEGESEPTSLGVLHSSEQTEMDIRIHLPNPDRNGDRDSLPASEALSRFDFSDLTRGTLFVKARYSDVRGEDCGGQVIERITFSVRHIEDVADLWSFGVQYQGVEEVPMEME